MKTLTNGQFYAIMVTAAFFNIMCMQGELSFSRITGTLIAGGLETLFIIFILYLKRNKVLENIFKSRAVVILYKIVLVVYAFSGLFKLLKIIETMDFNVSVLTGGILMAAVCIYAASLGFKTFARSSIAVIVFIVVSLAVMLFGAYDKADLSILTDFYGNSGVIGQVFRTISESSELILLPSLLLFAERNSGKAAIGYVVTRTALTVIISILGITLLGSSITDGRYPFFMIGEVSQPFSVQRADGIYMVLFTIVCSMNIITAETLRRNIK